jgi:PST family polysaccharide transporter
MSTLKINIGYLTAVQISNILLPFLTVPYLTRTLAPDGYGLIAYVLAIVAMLGILTDFGFGLSATKEVAAAFGDKGKIDSIIGSVAAVKAGIFLLIVLLTIFYNVWLGDRKTVTLSAIVLLSLFGQTFQPDWLFQGIERMRSIAVCTLVSKLLYVALVIATVKSSADSLFVLWANAASSCLTMGLGISIMLGMGYRPRFGDLAAVKRTFSGSTGFFLSRLAVGAYTAGSSLFLGHFSTMTQTGLYSISDQIYKALQSLLSPISQALYPNTIQTNNFALVIRIAKVMAGVSVLGLLIHLLYGKEIIEILFGAKFSGTKNIIAILLVALAFNTPSVLIGYPLLGALGRAGDVNRSVILGAIVHIAILFSLYMFNLFDAIYVASSVLVVELAVLCMRILVYRKHIMRKPLAAKI